MGTLIQTGDIKKYKKEKIQALPSSNIETGGNKLFPKNRTLIRCLFVTILFSLGWNTWRRRRGWGGKSIGGLPYEAHEWRLLRSKLLSHERLQPTCGRRKRRLAELAESLSGLILTCHPTVGVVGAAGTAVALILLCAGVVAIPVIPTSVSVGGRRAVVIAAVAIIATEAVFAAAAGAHAAVTLVPVHEVRVV